MKNTITKENLDAVFHAYDIRGLVADQLDEFFFETLGKAFVEFHMAKKIVVGHDIRNESKQFMHAFIRGATSMGCDVVNVGEIPTEMIYFATGSDQSYDGGIVITASHNPSEWNGCKMVGKGASAISSDHGLEEIKDLMSENKFALSENKGNVKILDLYPSYREKILSVLGDTDISKLKIIVDAGNGIGGKVFNYVFKERIDNFDELYFEPDGSFPNHVPDPLKIENIKEIKNKMVEETYDIGIAIDGDADRVFFLDAIGRNPSGVYTGAIIARYLLEKNPKSLVIHDPRIIWPISREITKIGGETYSIKAGHSFFKQKMYEMSAIFGAEMSSHFFFRDFYNADSGMYSIAIMLKLLASGLDFKKEMDFFYENYPISGEINYKVSNTAEVLERVKNNFKDAKVTTIDGVSIEYGDWRCNLRPSNTQPLLRLNIEAISKEIIAEKFKYLEKIIDGVRDNEPTLEGLI